MFVKLSTILPPLSLRGTPLSGWRSNLVKSHKMSCLLNIPLHLFLQFLKIGKMADVTDKWIDYKLDLLIINIFLKIMNVYFQYRMILAFHQPRTEEKCTQIFFIPISDFCCINPVFQRHRYDLRIKIHGRKPNRPPMPVTFQDFSFMPVLHSKSESFPARPGIYLTEPRPYRTFSLRGDNISLSKLRHFPDRRHQN